MTHEAGTHPRVVSREYHQAMEKNLEDENKRLRSAMEIVAINLESEARLSHDVRDAHVLAGLARNLRNALLGGLK